MQSKISSNHGNDAGENNSELDNGEEISEDQADVNLDDDIDVVDKA